MDLDEPMLGSIVKGVAERRRTGTSGFPEEVVRNEMD